MSESWGGAGSGWGNPVVGSTALRIPAINSPNFNLASPAASPTPSWAILQSGLAYFFGLVLSGGTITGPDYIIDTSGIFLYSGTPAAGNLVGSWAPVAGTDAFGNVYQKDFTIYIGTGGSVNINSSGGQFGNPAVLFNPPSATHVSLTPQVSATSNFPGAVNEQERLVMTSGLSGGPKDAKIELDSQSNDSTIPPSTLFTFGGNLFVKMTETLMAVSMPISCTLGTPANPSVITNGAWTRIASPFSNGWVSGGGGSDVNGIVYRMNNDGSFEVWLDVINPNAKVNSVLTTFAAPFQPTRNQKHQIAGSIANAVWAQLNTNGDLVLVGSTAANAEVNGRCMFYLGAFPP